MARTSDRIDAISRSTLGAADVLRDNKVALAQVEVDDCSLHNLESLRELRHQALRARTQAQALIDNIDGKTS